MRVSWLVPADARDRVARGCVDVSSIPAQDMSRLQYLSRIRFVASGVSSLGENPVPHVVNTKSYGSSDDLARLVVVLPDQRINTSVMQGISSGTIVFST